MKYKTEDFLLQKQSIDKHIAHLLKRTAAFDAVCDNLCVGVLLCGQDLAVEYANAHALRALGYTRAEFEDACLTCQSGLFAAGDVSDTLSMQQEEPIRFCARLLTKHRAAVRMEIAALSFECGDRSMTAIILEDSLEPCAPTVQNDDLPEYASLLEMIHGGVCVCRFDDLFSTLYANDGFYYLLGYSREEFKSLFDGKFARLIYPGDLERVRAQICAELRSGGSYSVEYRVKVKGSGRIWVEDKGCYLKSDGEGARVQSVLMNITERKRQEDALKTSYQRYEIAISHTDVDIFEYDILLNRIIQPDITAKKYGLPGIIENGLEGVIEMGSVMPDDAQKLRDMQAGVLAGEPFCKQEVTLYNAKGREVVNELTLTAIFDDSGRPVRAVGALHDITDTKRLEREQQFLTAMTSDRMLAFEANISTDAITAFGDKWFKQLSIPYFNKYSQIIDFCADRRINPEHQAAYLEFSSPDNLLLALERGENQLILEYQIMDADGEYCWIQTTISIIRDEKGEVKLRRYIKNIQAEKRKELELIYKAQRDGLTTLYNRSATEILIKDYLISSRGKNSAHAFVILDIDNFKIVNDTFGHKIGDLVLEETAATMKAHLREDDIIGRLGGDEFVVLMKNVGNDDFVRARAGELCAKLKKELSGEGEQYTVSASVGIAVFDRDGAAYEELYRNADRALYHSKNTGRNRVTIYSEIEQD